MSAPAPTRDLLTLGALSTGPVFVGVTFEIPLLPELGSLVGLTVLWVLALDGLRLGGDSAGFQVGNGTSVSTIENLPREVRNPVAALIGAGSIIGAGFIFEVWPLVLLGSLLGLAVVGGLATLSVLALDVISNEGESSRER